MTGIDPEHQKRRLRWAAQQLDLSPDASPEEARAAWLRKLPEVDFVPPREWRWAVESMVRGREQSEILSRADEAAEQSEEERLREEVEIFAIRFWELMPDARRQEWQALMDRAAFSQLLCARLRLLEAGLDQVSVPRETEEEVAVIELAGHIRDLFVLRPGPRSRLRQTIVMSMRFNWGSWQDAATILRRKYPALASMGIDLLHRLYDPAPSIEKLPKRPQIKPAAASGEWKVPKWVIVVCISLLIGAVRGVFNTSRVDRPTIYAPKDPPIDFNDPKFNWDNSGDAMKRLLEGSAIEKEFKDRAQEARRRREKEKSDTNNDKPGRNP